MSTTKQLIGLPEGYIWRPCVSCGRRILAPARKDGTAKAEFLKRPYCSNPDANAEARFDALRGNVEEAKATCKNSESLEQFLRWLCKKERTRRLEAVQADIKRKQQVEYQPSRPPTEGAQRYDNTQEFDTSAGTKKVEVAENEDDLGNISSVEPDVEQDKVKAQLKTKSGPERKQPMGPGRMSQSFPIVPNPANPDAPYGYIPGTDTPIRHPDPAMPQPRVKSKRAGPPDKYVPPRKPSAMELAERLTGKWVKGENGQKIRVREKGRPLIDRKNKKKGFAPLAESLGAHDRISPENILAWFNWRNVEDYPDHRTYITTPPVHTGNRIPDQKRLDRLQRDLTSAHARLQALKAQHSELDVEHDSFSAKVRPDLDAKTRNMYKAQTRRKRDGVDKEIVGTKSTIAELMNAIKQARLPENYIEEVIPGKREERCAPGYTFTQENPSECRWYEELLLEVQTGKFPSGFGKLENTLIRQAIHYGIFCPLPEVWLEDHKLPFGCIDELKYIAACHRLSPEAVTIIRYSLQTRRRRGGFDESEQDDPENTLIRKTGGSNLGLTIYGGRRTRTGVELESFDTTRKNEVGTPSGGTGDNDQWDKDSSSDGDDG